MHGTICTEIVDALRQYGAESASGIEELCRWIAFSIPITNIDDHLINHGFLHARGGAWRLSPAFDIYPFPDRARALKAWILEAVGPEATIEVWMSVILYFRITSERVRRILAEVEGVVGGWREIGRTLGLTRLDLDAFADAFEHNQPRAAQAAIAWKTGKTVASITRSLGPDLAVLRRLLYRACGPCITRRLLSAQMAELVDALVSGTSG